MVQIFDCRFALLSKNLSFQNSHCLRPFSATAYIYYTENTLYFFVASEVH